MENVIKLLKKISIILLAAMLSGCFMFSRNDDSVLSQQAKNKRNFIVLSDRLSKSLVDIYYRSNSVLLLLSNRHFFVNGSANFTENAYEVLDLILAFSSYYKDSRLVIVTGYSRGYCNSRLSKALALERASRIVQYLWRSGIDATFVYADGKKVMLNGGKGDIIDGVSIEFLHS